MNWIFLNGSSPLAYRRTRFSISFRERIDLGFEGQEFVNEVHVFDETVIVFCDLQEGHEVVGLLLLHLLSERAEDLLDLGAVDLAAAVLVEDLETLDVVLLAAGVGGDSLRLLQDRVEVGELDSLSTQFGGSSELLDRLVGEGAAEGSEDVAQVEGVNIVAFVGLVEDHESVLCFAHGECDEINRTKGIPVKNPLKREDPH